jgi:hypothetical protein
MQRLFTRIGFLHFQETIELEDPGYIVALNGGHFTGATETEAGELVKSRVCGESVKCLPHLDAHIPIRERSLDVKPKKPRKPKVGKNRITCPVCGSVEIQIYERLDLVRNWLQDEDGAGGLMDFEEELDCTDDFLDFSCGSCSHAWRSTEFTTMESLMEEVYGEVTY